MGASGLQSLRQRLNLGFPPGSSTFLNSKTGGRCLNKMNLQFKKGEKVVYPAHGVAVIDDIQVKVISGTERRFYVLKILGTEKMTIMIPTENVDSVGLRRVICKDMVD